MKNISTGLQDSWWMFFDTFWALLFGFAISGAIQAFTSRSAMLSNLGDHKPKTIVKASVLGAISSSCSYAASAISKSLIEKGADFTTAIVFMFASTNLVFELGLVLWTLLGWQFAAAEFVGGFIMITLLALILPRFDFTLASATTSATKLTSRKPSWHDAAGYTVGDLTMVRFELVIGFVVAGLADTLIPASFWHHLFLSGHGVIGGIENAILGPVIAFISFVCSVGNVPLSAALWNSGISFGGTIAFIFADLLTIPLALIYRKFYGTKVTTRLVLVFWGVMSISGYLTEKIFQLIGEIPPKVNGGLSSMHGSHFGNNVTTWLNGLAVAVGMIVIWLYVTRDKSDGSPYAIDPICGMQVEKNIAAATLVLDGQTLYFCAPSCKESFMKSLPA